MIVACLIVAGSAAAALCSGVRLVAALAGRRLLDREIARLLRGQP